jgi:hypothetical protein
VLGGLAVLLPVTPVAVVFRRRVPRVIEDADFGDRLRFALGLIGRGDGAGGCRGDQGQGSGGGENGNQHFSCGETVAHVGHNGIFRSILDYSRRLTRLSRQYLAVFDRGMTGNRRLLAAVAGVLCLIIALAIWGVVSLVNERDDLRQERSSLQTDLRDTHDSLTDTREKLDSAEARLLQLTTASPSHSCSSPMTEAQRLAPPSTAYATCAVRPKCCSDSTQNVAVAEYTTVLE